MPEFLTSYNPHNHYGHEHEDRSRRCLQCGTRLSPGCRGFCWGTSCEAKHDAEIEAFYGEDAR